MEQQAKQELTAVLERLEAALAENVERSEAMVRRSQAVRAELNSGRSMAEIMQDGSRVRIVGLLTENIRALQDAGSELRRVVARTLRTEGMTTKDIAELFGVTRQRISALLNQPSRT